MKVLFFVLSLFCYLAHAFIWIQYSEAFTDRVYKIQFAVNFSLLLILCQNFFLSFVG